MAGPNQNGRWYEPVNPNEHSYTPGYGFSTRPPFLVEQRLILGYSSAAAFVLLGFLFLSSFLPQMLLQITYRFLPPSAPFAVDEFLWQCYVLIGTVLSLMLPFWAFTVYTRIPRDCAVPVRRVDWRLILGAVLVAMAVSVLGGYANGAADQLFYSLGVEFFNSFETPESVPALVVYAINMTLIPAVFEEIAFRGILMQSLRRFGDSFALVVSALLFSLVHQIPVNMPNAFLMGLAIGYFVLFTGSVTTGIVIHLIYNTLVLLSGMFDYLPHEASSIAYGAFDLICLLAGFGALVELLRRYPNMFALRSSQTVNPSEQKLRVFLCSIPMFLFYLVIIWQAARYRI